MHIQVVVFIKKVLFARLLNDYYFIKKMYDVVTDLICIFLFEDDTGIF